MIQRGNTHLDLDPRRHAYERPRADDCCAALERTTNPGRVVGGVPLRDVALAGFVSAERH